MRSFCFSFKFIANFSPKEKGIDLSGQRYVENGEALGSDRQGIFAHFPILSHLVHVEQAAFFCTVLLPDPFVVVRCH